MKKSPVARLLLKLGVLGVFLYGAVVSVGSFFLYGCICTDSLIESITPAPAKPKPVDTNPEGEPQKSS